MKIGDKVKHVDYPTSIGTIVGRHKPVGSSIPFFLVMWNDSKDCSRHIEAALTKVSQGRHQKDGA